MIRFGIKAALPWESFKINEVYVAASGMEALRIIEKNKINLLITDISMTEMTGLELIEKVKILQPNIKIIVLTGYDDFDYVHQCLRMKVEDFFLKPVDEDKLGMAIEKIINSIEKSNQIDQEQKFIKRAKGVKEQSKLEQIMRHIIHDKIDKNEMDYLIQEYNFTNECKLHLVIIVPAINIELETNKVKFIALSIKNICIDIFDSQGEGITFEDDDGKLIVCIFDSANSDEIISRIETLNNILNDEYHMRPRVVVADPINNIEKLKIAYNDAIYLLETEKDSFQEIIQSHFMEERYRIFNEVFLEIKRIMIINTGNVDLITRAYNSFKQAAESYNLANNMIKRCCFDIASTVYFSHISNSGETIDNKLTSLLNSLMYASKDDVLDFTLEFLIRLFSDHGENMHEIIYKSKAYINENLAGNLSVSSLASDLNITSNYFSRLFKKVTGEGCNEYIVRMRIEKSKALLETTSLKTGEIAYMVGYNDTNYFSLAFKKYLGVSPTKYRNSIM